MSFSIRRKQTFIGLSLINGTRSECETHFVKPKGLMANRTRFTCDFPFHWIIFSMYATYQLTFSLMTSVLVCTGIYHDIISSFVWWNNNDVQYHCVTYIILRYACSCSQWMTTQNVQSFVVVDCQHEWEHLRHPMFSFRCLSKTTKAGMKLIFYFYDAMCALYCIYC